MTEETAAILANALITRDGAAKQLTNAALSSVLFAHERVELAKVFVHEERVINRIVWGEADDE